MGWREDNAGRVPEVGDYVAYNMSGQIATGWIKSVGKSKAQPVFIIIRHYPERPHQNPESRVRGGAQCVLVLETKDGVKLV